MLLRQSRRAPAREAGSGYLVLRQPPFYRGIGLFSAGLGAFLLVGTLLSFDWELLGYDRHEQIGFGGAMLGALLFLVLSWPMLQASATTLTLTPLGLAADGPRGQHRFLPWADITTVRYNLLTYELKIATPTATIRAGRYLVGFDLLLAELTHRLGRIPAQMGLPPGD